MNKRKSPPKPQIVEPKPLDTASLKQVRGGNKAIGNVEYGDVG